MTVCNFFAMFRSCHTVEKTQWPFFHSHLSINIAYVVVTRPTFFYRRMYKRLRRTAHIVGVGQQTFIIHTHTQWLLSHVQCVFLSSCKNVDQHSSQLCEVKINIHQVERYEMKWKYCGCWPYTTSRIWYIWSRTRERERCPFPC